VWLCSKLLAAEIDADVLVPEGFEDASCEGSSPWQVQVKSRQHRRGDFSAAEAAQHVLALAVSAQGRQLRGLPGAPVLVLERAVDGYAPARWGEVIADLPADNPLLPALERLGAARGLSPAEIRPIAETVSVYVLPWHEARNHVTSMMARRYGLPLGVAGPVVLALRDAVAVCIDTNAESGWATRAGMDRSQIERVASAAAANVDRSALETALATGLCEAVDFDTPLPDERFYEGVAAQPGHVAAGLPVARPELVEQVASAIDHRAPVLITGPSGVGKSVLLWMAASEMRDVLWFRVRRLREADVGPLVSLARAYGPTERAKVGFLVDGVGLGGNESWDLLVRELAPLAGIALLGTARVEDLQPLRSLADCVLIEPRLDERTAERIHVALRASGVTKAAHWREAYRDADGLTLEYTHLLTSGRRLADVLGEQVRQRVNDPDRGLEVGIIALVAAAHRWGADLGLRAVQQSLGAPDSSFRRAVGRLKDEHLIYERKGRLSGLHQLRSSALSDEVWRVPPPTVEDSAAALIGLVDDEQLTAVVMSVLTDQPDLHDFVTTRLRAELGARASLTAWVSALQGLRIVDFRERCGRIVAEMDRLGVAPTDRAITIQFTMLGSDPPAQFKSEVRKAIRRIAPELEKRSRLRDAMARAGVEVLACALCDGPLDGARRLLAVLQGTAVDVAPFVVAHLRGSSLEAILRAATCEEVGDVLATARLVSQPLAVHLFEAAGGHASVARRLKAEYPELTRVGAVEREGAWVAEARWLHVSDEYAGDPDAAVRAFATILLRCFPMCDSVDVEARLPGDLPIQPGGHVMAISHLKRQYDHPPTEVAWNRLRMNVAAAAGGLIDATARVAEVRQVVIEAQAYLSDLVRVWCTGLLLPGDRQHLVRAGDALTGKSGRLRAPVSVSYATLRSVDAFDGLPSGDPVHGLAWALVENLSGRLFASKPQWASLAAFVGEQLRKRVSEIRQEQWELLGEEPPNELGAMDTMLACLNTVLLELAADSLSRSAVRAIAAAGPRGSAIHRVAQVARGLARQAEDDWAARLVALATGAGLTVELHRRPLSTPPPVSRFASEFAVGVQVDDLAQWTTTLEAIRGAVVTAGAHAADRGTVLVFPICAHRPVRMLAQAIIIGVFPSTDLFDSWRDSLDQPWSTPLADAVVDAHRALQVISGLGVLDSQRGAPGVEQSRVDQQIERFREALDTIGRLQPQDLVVAELRTTLVGLADRVQAEVDDAEPEEAVLAARIAAGAMGTPNDETAILGAVITLALTWDTDPEAAGRLLRAWEQSGSEAQ